jgi:hypothetical protein
MKKLLGSTLALAMFLPAGANAELLKNLKVSGQLDVQTTSARNITDFVTRPTGANSSPASTANNDRIGDAHARLMVRGDWDLLDDVHARVTLVKGAENNGARVYGEASQDLNDLQNTTNIEEAFVKIDKLFGHLDTTIGRQFYGEAGDLIIYYGLRDNFGQRVSAIDAFRADWNGEHMQVTGLAGRTTSGNNLAAGAVADVDVRGLVVSCNKHENVKPTAYLYNRVTHGTAGLGATLGSTGAGAGAGKNDNLWVAGVKVKGEVAGFSGALEFAKNFGQDRLTYAGVTTGAQNVNYTGHAIKLNAAYKADVQDVAVFNPWAEAARGSGDNNFDHAGNRNFQSIATDYRPGAIYGRFDTGAALAVGSAAGLTGNSIASNGLTNRLIWGVGVKATPAALNKLTTGVAFYRYAFDRLPTLSTGQRRSRNIGSEIDLVNEWKHSENVSVKVTLGSFQPGAYIRDVRGANAATNPAVMAAGDVSIKF